MHLIHPTCQLKATHDAPVQSDADGPKHNTCHGCFHLWRWRRPCQPVFIYLGSEGDMARQRFCPCSLRSYNRYGELCMETILVNSMCSRNPHLESLRYCRQLQMCRLNKRQGWNGLIHFWSLTRWSWLFLDDFCIFEVQQRPWASTEAWWRCQADVRKLDRPEGCGRFPDGFSQKASEPSLARFRTRVYRFSEFYSYTPYTYYSY